MSSSKLEQYKFKTQNWPPPKEMKHSETYLIGFDEDNQPYIVKWENKKGDQNWMATTLSDNRSSDRTAVPREYIFGEADKIIKWWAEAPMTVRAIAAFQAKKKKKDDDE